MNNNQLTYIVKPLHTGQKQASLTAYLLLFCMFMHASCENYSLEEEKDQSANTMLRVVTRSSDNEGISYPLRIYAFSADDKLRAQKTVYSDLDDATLSLPEKSSYKLIAVGADASSFVIPANPKYDDIIRYTTSVAGSTAGNGFCSANPLMMGFADIILLDSPNAVCYIQMLHQMCSLQITLNNIPEIYDDVRVSVSSPYAGINFRGAGVETSCAQISLTRAEDGTWKCGKIYVLPTVAPLTTFTISCNSTDGEIHSSVTYQSTLRAGTPYVLNGNFLNGSFHVDANVVAPEWGETVYLRFDFGQGVDAVITPDGEQEGEQNDENETSVQVEQIPAAFTLWKNHMVVAVLDNEGNEADAQATEATLLLISCTDWAGMTSAFNTNSPTTAFERASSYDEYGMKGWRIPTVDESRILYRAYQVANDDPENEELATKLDWLIDACGADPIAIADNKGNRLRYLCADAEKTFSFSANSVTKAGASVKTYHLRLVRSVKVYKR